MYSDNIIAGYFRVAPTRPLLPTANEALRN